MNWLYVIQKINKKVWKHTRGIKSGVWVLSLGVVSMLVLGVAIVAHPPRQSQLTVSEVNPKEKIQKDEDIAKPVIKKQVDKQTIARQQPEPIAIQNPTVNARIASPQQEQMKDDSCLKKLNEYYSASVIEFDRVYAEKQAALALLDALYEEGVYEEKYGEDPDAYNQWQIDRADIIKEYAKITDKINEEYRKKVDPLGNCY